jgi:ABC-type uncharacterized transport system YnjBCD substrate-binding protein
MKKIVFSLVWCCLLVMLVACGNDSEQANAEEEKESTTTAETNTEPEEKNQKEFEELNIATAGDTNMVDIQEQEIKPIFHSKISEDTKIRVVGTGAGDAGSLSIFEKLHAQGMAGSEEWDIDLAIVHQSVMSQLIENDLIEKWVPMSANKEYVVSEDSKQSLGTNVEDYVIPMFHSQVAIAYNPDNIKNGLNSFEELESWVKENPQRFGYNGITNGASGVAFTTAYLYWKTGDYEQLTQGPYDEQLESKWEDVFKELKSLPVTYTNGNNGTLDMLNRGEIDAGPVWVDMFNSWVNEGRLNPNLELALLEPGLPGQPMYVVIPKKAKNKEAALAYADLLTSPEVQSDVIVEKYNWYPGIDANAVLPHVSEDGKNRLFKNISADILNERGQSLPINEYFERLKEAYEKY